MGNGSGGDADGEHLFYDGPYVHSRHGTPAVPWVWIANGIRPTDEAFAPPAALAKEAIVARAAVPSDSISAGVGAGAYSAEQGSSPAVTVRVLGPVEVEGWRKVPERAIVTELACYLALHPERAISGDELRFALRPDAETDIGAKSLRSYVSLLRSALGGDLVPPATTDGYQVSPLVVTDWGLFEHLAQPGAELDDLVEALKLVRGRPFAGVPAPGYGWVYAELLVSRIEAAIAEVAASVSDTYICSGDIASALWAARQGLVAVPADIELWRYYLATARASGPAEWRAARREARATLGDAATDLLGREPTAAEYANGKRVLDEGATET